MRPQSSSTGPTVCQAFVLGLTSFYTVFSFDILWISDGTNAIPKYQKREGSQIGNCIPWGKVDFQNKPFLGITVINFPLAEYQLDRPDMQSVHALALYSGLNCEEDSGIGVARFADIGGAQTIDLSNLTLPRNVRVNSIRWINPQAQNPAGSRSAIFDPEKISNLEPGGLLYLSRRSPVPEEATCKGFIALPQSNWLYFKEPDFLELMPGVSERTVRNSARQQLEDLRNPKGLRRYGTRPLSDLVGLGSMEEESRIKITGPEIILDPISNPGPQNQNNRDVASGSRDNMIRCSVAPLSTDPSISGARPIQVGRRTAGRQISEKELQQQYRDILNDLGNTSAKDLERARTGLQMQLGQSQSQDKGYQQMQSQMQNMMLNPYPRMFASQQQKPQYTSQFPSYTSMYPNDLASQQFGFPYQLQRDRPLQSGQVFPENMANDLFTKALVDEQKRLLAEIIRAIDQQKQATNIKTENDQLYRQVKKEEDQSPQRIRSGRRILPVAGDPDVWADEEDHGSPTKKVKNEFIEGGVKKEDSMGYSSNEESGQIEEENKPPFTSGQPIDDSFWEEFDVQDISEVDNREQAQDSNSNEDGDIMQEIEETEDDYSPILNSGSNRRGVLDSEEGEYLDEEGLAASIEEEDIGSTEFLERSDVASPKRPSQANTVLLSPDSNERSQIGEYLDLYDGILGDDI